MIGETEDYNVDIEDCVSPAAITGSSSACVGSTITLTDVIAGGTWGVTGAASIAGLGVVTGVTPGTATITYSNGCGTPATTIVTIVAPTTPITGLSSVMVGSEILLSDASLDGAWSSGDLSIATVNSSGYVSGVAAGVVTITYTGECGSVTTYITVTGSSAPPSGISLVNTNSYYDIHPNPTTGSIFISTPGTANVSISNMAGQSVYYNPAYLGNSEINTSNLPNGIYLLNINGRKSLINKQ